jgi:hypothetical protein
MSDDLNKKVQQIAQLLGHDNVPDNVRELVSLLSSSLEKIDGRDGDSSPKVDSSAASAASMQFDSSKEPVAEQPSTAQPVFEDPTAANRDVLDSARKALNRLNTSNDPRINLLNAIKPFMNTRRQKKIGNCIQLLQIASLSRLLNEQENRRGEPDAL